MGAFEALMRGSPEKREAADVYDYDPIIDDGDIATVTLPLQSIYEYGAVEGRMTFDLKEARRKSAILCAFFGVIAGMMLVWVTPGASIIEGGFILAIVFGVFAAGAGYKWGHTIAPKPKTLYRRVWELISPEQLFEMLSGPLECDLLPECVGPLWAGWQNTGHGLATERGEPFRLTKDLPKRPLSDLEFGILQSFQTPLGWWYYRHLYPLKYTFLEGEPFIDEPTVPEGLALMLGTEEIYGNQAVFEPKNVRATYMFEIMQQRTDKALWGLQPSSPFIRLQTGVAVAVALGIMIFAGFMTIATADVPVPVETDAKSVKTVDNGR